MALNTVTTGNTILAGDLNQLVNVLQRAAGQTEAGKYHVIGSAYQTNASIGAYVNSLSRVSTPSSVTIDTSGGIVGTGAVAASDLSANGFLVSGTGIQNLNVQAWGNYTIQY